MQKITVSRTWLLSIGIILIIVSFILIIWFFLNGRTSVAGEWNEPQRTETLSCEATMAYPFFQYGSTSNRIIKINSIFKGDHIDSISLIIISYYNNTDAIKDDIDINTIAISEYFAKDGLSFDALNKYFSKMEEGVQFSLYATANELDTNTLKYFFLDTNILNENRSAIETNYTNKGFSCTTKN